MLLLWSKRRFKPLSERLFVGKKGPSDDWSVDLIRLNLLKNDKKLFDVNTLLTIEVQTNILIFQFNSEVKLCWTQKWFF